MPSDANDEFHRHRCEVRQVLRWRVQRGREWLREWLAGVAKTRGEQVAKQLNAEAASQWQRGNRGERGDWR